MLIKYMGIDSTHWLPLADGQQRCLGMVRIRINLAKGHNHGTQFGNRKLSKPLSIDFNYFMFQLRNCLFMGTYLGLVCTWNKRESHKITQIYFAQLDILITTVRCFRPNFYKLLCITICRTATTPNGHPLIHF